MPAAKILERAELGRRLAQLRALGRKVVFTCGVFDIVHVGHVRYLEFARALGDALVVGINSDDSARRLHKAPGRPIVEAAERAEVVAALESVDYVCIFDETRPDETIRALKPDVHVKSAQYAAGDLPEAAAVAENGGVVVLAPHYAGHSTTALLGRLARSS
ncbi:MAG: adenylyltransferase/cytidyltransferase family protein [Candidatus Eremiobacteraeota bacterium]|nr:adenylyltransferase/cytidyltransferase family protein [Candidatus Eremiobacteraeota bacterium]